MGWSLAGVIGGGQAGIDWAVFCRPNPLSFVVLICEPIQIAVENFQHRFIGWIAEFFGLGVEGQIGAGWNGAPSTAPGLAAEHLDGRIGLVAADAGKGSAMGSLHRWCKAASGDLQHAPRPSACFGPGFNG